MDIFEQLEKLLFKGFSEINLDPKYFEMMNAIIVSGIIVIACFIANYITQQIFLTAVNQFAKKSKTVWDDIFVEKKFFHRLAMYVPLVITHFCVPFAYHKYPITAHIIQVIVKSAIALVTARVIDAFLDSSHAIYELNPDSKQKPIKGYIQVLKIMIYFILVLFILSIIFNKSLVYFFSGLGALAAVLMLVFKDTILGLVAGVQLSSNNMLKPGDWITFSKYGADGTVIEISLNTVKVQNFDKSIVTIPTYACISESFQNWRGMEESGGRRFKRLLLFDSRSLMFCDSEFIERLKADLMLQSFIDAHLHEIEKEVCDKKNLVRLTNMGIYRMYIEFLLNNHDQIHKEMTLFVRLGQISENGISLEIFSFATEIKGKDYEKLQASIVEHLLTIASVFKLSVFQKPSGNDMRIA